MEALPKVCCVQVSSISGSDSADSDAGDDDHNSSDDDSEPSTTGRGGSKIGQNASSTKEPQALFRNKGITHHHEQGTKHTGSGLQPSIAGTERLHCHMCALHRKVCLGGPLLMCCKFESLCAAPTLLSALCKAHAAPVTHRTSCLCCYSSPPSRRTVQMAKSLLYGVVC